MGRRALEAANLAGGPPDRAEMLHHRPQLHASGLSSQAGLFLFPQILPSLRLGGVALMGGIPEGEQEKETGKQVGVCVPAM